MKKRFKAFVSLLACAVLLAAALPGARVDVVCAEETIEGLYQKLRDLGAQEQQWDSLIDQAQEGINEEQSKIEYLNSQIGLLEDRIVIYNDLLTQLGHEIDVLGAKLDVSQDEMDAYYELYYERVRANYEAGRPSALEVLLSAGSFTDYLTRIDVAEQIMEYDNNLLDAMDAKIQQIEVEKAAVEEVRTENQAVRDQLDAEQAELEAMRAESRALVAQLGSEIDAYQAQKEQAEALKAQLNEQLDELIKAQTGFVGGAFMWPVPGCTYITSRFGYRSDPFTGATKFHSGVDIGCRMGSELRAANGGVVVSVSYEYAGGYYIVIDHGGGYSTRYFHLSAQYVTEGQTVSKGELIGLTGMSGAAVTGPHLHFEFRLKNAEGYTEPLDALQYITPF